MTRKRPGFFLPNIDMLKKYFQKKVLEMKNAFIFAKQNTTTS